MVSVLTVFEPFSGDELRQFRAVEEAGLHDMQEGGHHLSAIFSFSQLSFFLSKFFDLCILFCVYCNHCFGDHIGLSVDPNSNPDPDFANYT